MFGSIGFDCGAFWNGSTLSGHDSMRTLIMHPAKVSNIPLAARTKGVRILFVSASLGRDLRGDWTGGNHKTTIKKQKRKLLFY